MSNGEIDSIKASYVFDGLSPFVISMGFNANGDTRGIIAKMRAISAYTDISGCKLWVDSLGGLTLSGGNVIAMADQSGAGVLSGFTVAQAVTNGLAAAVGPVYAASDANFGNTPSLTFASTGGIHTALDTPTIAAQGGIWTFMFCVRNTGVQDANNSRFFFDGSGAAATANRWNSSLPGSASNVNGTTDAFFSLGPSLTKYSLISNLGATAHVIGVAVRQESPSALMTLFRDSSIVCRALFANGTPRTLTGLRLGHSAVNAGAFNFDGQINALVAWNRILTDGEFLRAGQLMARRHGVTLPARTAKTRTAVPVPGAVGGRTWIL